MKAHWLFFPPLCPGIKCRSITSPLAISILTGPRVTKQLRLSRHHDASIAKLKAWGVIEKAEEKEAGITIRKIREFYEDIFRTHRYIPRRQSAFKAQPRPVRGSSGQEPEPKPKPMAIDSPRRRPALTAHPRPARGSLGRESWSFALDSPHRRPAPTSEPTPARGSLEGKLKPVAVNPQTLQGGNHHKRSWRDTLTDAFRLLACPRGPEKVNR